MQTDNHRHILTLIARERENQDEQWGGKEHDDTHEEGDWARIIVHQLDKLEANMGPITDREFERRMVKVAAVAIAALEAHFRVTDKKFEDQLGIFG